MGTVSPRLNHGCLFVITYSESSMSYSTADVARRLGVSIPTVQRWVDQGRLRAWKTVGGHRRIDAHSVEQLMESLAAQTEGVPVRRDPQLPTVLIVEDNASDRDLLQVLVRTLWPGVEPQLADNGFQALLAVGRKMPDIVISDIVMPHMNGVEMLRQLLQAQSQAPRLLVAVSSLAPSQIDTLGGLPPKVLYIAKPVEPELAAAALSSAWQQVC